MAIKKWTLIDVANQIYCDELTIGSETLKGKASACMVVKRRLRGGLSDGVDVVRVTSGEFSFEVLPTRGMGLWKAWLGGLEIGWRSPVRGPVHPHFVPLMEPGGFGWLDGFDELLVRCGLESNGAPDFDEHGRLRYPLHGRIGNRPAHYVDLVIDEDSGEISLTGVVEETRFHFQKLRMTSTVTARLGERSLRIHDRVENLSASGAEIQMLYHVNFGQPLLEAGSRCVAPTVVSACVSINNNCLGSPCGRIRPPSPPSQRCKRVCSREFTSSRRKDGARRESRSVDEIFYIGG